MTESVPYAHCSELSTSFLVHADGQFSPQRRKRYYVALFRTLRTNLSHSLFGPVLGKGRFAVVRAATCKKTGRGVAVKMIDKSRCKVEEQVL
jgi:hypothetical protein